MCSTDVDQEKVKNKVADLKSKYGEKLSKENAPFNEGKSMDGSVSFYQGGFIVALNDKEMGKERDDLLEQIKKEMDKNSSWWRLRWHECTHDGDTRTVERTRELPDGSTETFTEQVKGGTWENVEKSDSSMIPGEVEY